MLLECSQLRSCCCLLLLHRLLPVLKCIQLSPVLLRIPCLHTRWQGLWQGEQICTRHR